MATKKSKLPLKKRIAIKIWLNACPEMLKRWKDYRDLGHLISFDEFVGLTYSKILKLSGKEDKPID